ncbi:hypothetical protein [Streptantibioticus ferralitis]|uniref:GNAT family N-acetyltransferase n=1 Tax=Streptantibioticus ferralitis TaxID=236510 RepID=A0ABT5YSX2_9ACTN|nr:hypothetical protein [Streptantibioticus ferralitis]MDF2254710.1 hypothetical protein [Streptantibioticus ferralitis]
MDVTHAVTTTVYPGESALTIVEEFVHLRRLSSQGHSPQRVEQQIGGMRDRLAQDARKPGFLAVTARIGSRLCGFGTAVRSTDPVPAHPAPDAWLPHQWPADAMQITDLTVAPVARGRGVRTRLLDVLLLPALDDRAWVAADPGDRATLVFFRCQGWRQTVFPSPGNPSDERAQVVLLAPRHPALADASAAPW